MQINIKTINVLRKKDVDSQFRYSFDEALSYLVKKHYKTETDILTLTRKLLNDFGLFDVKIIQTNKDYSYATALTNCIAFSQYHIEKNCIETAFHEFAHIIAQYVFSLPTGNQHDSVFSSILKFLLLKYEILTADQIDYAQTISHTELSDAAIVKLEITSHAEANQFINSLGLEREPKYNFEHTDQKQQLNYRVMFCENDIAVISVRQLYGFEIEQNIFSELTDSELSSFVLFSPNVLLNDNGEIITSKYYGCMGFIQYSVNSNHRLDFFFELTDSKAVTTTYINNLVAQLKLNKIKYKRSTTINEFELLKKQLNEELNKRYFK